MRDESEMRGKVARIPSSGPKQRPPEGHSEPAIPPLGSVGGLSLLLEEARHHEGANTQNHEDAAEECCGHLGNGGV